MSWHSTCSLSTLPVCASFLQLPASPSWTHCHCSSSDCHLEQQAVTVHLCYEVTIVYLKKISILIFFFQYWNLAIYLKYIEIHYKLIYLIYFMFSPLFFFFLVIKNEISFWQQIQKSVNNQYIWMIKKKNSHRILADFLHIPNPEAEENFSMFFSWLRTSSIPKTSMFFWKKNKAFLKFLILL